MTCIKNGTGFKKIYLATGYIDLWRGIDGLAAIIRFQFKLDPYDKNMLFFFCGRCCDRIKDLLWEGDGFLLNSLIILFLRLYKNVIHKLESQETRF